MPLLLCGSGDTLDMRHSTAGCRANGEERRGMTGLSAATRAGLLTIYGDRVSVECGAPLDGDAANALAWCRANFLRFAGTIFQRDRVMMWTDEAAACPLFYAFTESGELVASSEAAVLASLSPASRGLACFGSQRPLPATGSTIFEGVFAVPAGSFATMTRTSGRWTVSTASYRPQPARADVVDIEPACALVRNVLDAAVARATAGLDEVAISLSGGVDSSSVAFLARSKVSKMRSYTIGTPYGDEFDAARDVASELGCVHHELTMTDGDLAVLLPELIRSFETWDPLTLQIAAPAAFLHKSLRGSSPVFLTGYGADLLFAGVLDASLAEDAVDQTIREQIALTVPTNEFSPTFAFRQGCTVRHPFWDREVIAAALRIRGRLKLRDGEVKYVLRKAMASSLPARIAWRKKLGIHQGTAMSEMFASVLGSPDPIEQHYALRDIARDVFAHNPTAELSPARS